MKNSSLILMVLLSSCIGQTKVVYHKHQLPARPWVVQHDLDLINANRENPKPRFRLPPLTEVQRFDYVNYVEDLEDVYEP